MHASNGILFNHESPMRGETLCDTQDCARPPLLNRGRKIKPSSGNLMPCATGVMRVTTLKGCGCGSCSKTSPTGLCASNWREASGP